MLIYYEIVCTERRIDGYGACNVFGLKAFDSGGISGEPICCVEDISPNRQFVEMLCDLLRFHDVQPVHIKDIVIDAIS